MAILPSSGSRHVSFTRTNLPKLPVHSQDRANYVDEDINQLPPLQKDERLQNFIYNNSNSRSVRLCSQRSTCMRRYCPWCDSRLAANAREAVRSVSRQFSKCLTFTSTVRSDPSLVSAFDSHASTTRFFLENGWLTKRSSAWFRESHVTYRDGGWHVHVHWVVFCGADEDFATLRKEIKFRWLTAARRAGTTASPEGQHLALRDDVDTAVRYATKGSFRCSTHRTAGTLTFGDIWARFQAGEVEGAELMAEVEALYLKPRRQWRRTGGRFRRNASKSLPQK
jgi:hypothetical protein